MKYYGIKTPKYVCIDTISDSKDISWANFFYKAETEELSTNNNNLAEAKKVCKDIGYKCVELVVKEDL